MEEQTVRLNLGQFLFSASRALDAVEMEVVGAVQNHSRRVAYLAVKLGEQLGLSREERADLAACASLHDNALTEYITVQRRNGNTLPIGEIRGGLQYHCDVGEENVRVFPFHQQRSGAIRFHHENFDGSGLFGLRGEEIPLMARILRLADHLDVQFGLSRWDADKRRALERHLEENAGVLYDRALVRPMAALFTREAAEAMTDERIEDSLRAAAPLSETELSYNGLIKISAMFAHIIDYKSPFTMYHSAGIAEKAKRMAEYYAFDFRTANEIYIAALLHDIGKLATPDRLLEKPGKLTGEEYTVVKEHVWRTHEILKVVDAFERIEPWASGHHERLDGSGYYRGCGGDGQDFCTRLLACIDVYQALVEERPYRKGMEPERAMEILRGQAEAGKLDARIVDDIGRVLRDEGPVCAGSPALAVP